MIIVEVEGGKDGIEKALKKYKRKFERIKMMKQLRNRKEFEKPSVKRRNQIKKAIYVEQKFGNNE
jgi:small subunit ribosomal protein S21